MKRKLILMLILGGLLGVPVGFALGIFIYPFWFLTGIANEQPADPAGQRLLASGRFIHANPSDPIHWGKGGVAVLRRADGAAVVHLQPDFEVGPGPRFHVYLVDRAEVRSNDDFRASRALDLGRLRAFKGSQVYPVPAAHDLGSARSVVIWCKEFSVLITPATLVPPV